LFFIIAASLLSMLKENQMHSEHIKDCNLFKCQIIESIQEKKNSYSTKLIIKSGYINNKWIKINKKSIAYLQKSKLTNTLNIGNYILIKANFTKIKNNHNPNEFNISNYYKSQSINYQTYIKSNNINLLQHSKNKFNLRLIAEKYRSKLINIYKKHGISKNSLGILSALCLGDKSNLDFEIKKAWSDAGVIHVLAVSGLHVGIIYLILSIILRVITNNHNWGQIWQVSLIHWDAVEQFSFCFLLPNIYSFNFQSESCAHQIKEQYLFKQQMLHETYRP
jgi:competence protein ComEC